MSACLLKVSMESAMEVTQATEVHAANIPDSKVKLLDCSQAPEVLALGNLSDAQLVDLLRGDPDNAVYLIAFYHLHAGFVRALLGSENNSADLNCWIWFSAFETLIKSPKKVIPVVGWLGRLVALALMHREQPPVQGDLPIPLAWYLHQSLESMPIPLRITAVMSGIAKNTDQEVSEFFYARQIPLSVVKVEQLRNESNRFFVSRIPVDVRRLYFGDPLDVETPIQVLSRLGMDVPAEIQRFERWQGIPFDDSIPPIFVDSSQGNDPQPTSEPSKNAVGAVLVGLLLIAGGAVALRTLVPDTQLSAVSPAPSALSIPMTTASQETTTRTATTQTASSKAIDTTVVPNSNAKPKAIVPNPASTSSVAIKPKVAVGDQLPLLDDAPPTRAVRLFAVLVADPQKQLLTSVRRFEPGSYYRSLEGQAWIQVGAYNSFSTATLTMEKFKAKGFTVALGRT